MFAITDAKLGYGHKVILEDVNITLKAGTLLGIIGKSGSGKTTLLSALTGENELLAGTFDYNFKSISAIFQNNGIFEWLTVLENLQICCPNKREEDINRICERLEIAQLLNQYGSKLSQGQKQRVQIARTFLSDADLILLDEPTSSLDVVNKAQFLSLLKDELKPTQAAVLVSHDIEEIVMLSDEIIHINNRQIKNKFVNVETKDRDYNNPKLTEFANYLREVVINEN